MKYYIVWRIYRSSFLTRLFPTFLAQKLPKAYFNEKMN